MGDYRSKTNLNFTMGMGRNQRSGLTTDYKSKTTLSNYSKPTKLDYSSGDPFYNIKKEQKEYYD